MTEATEKELTPEQIEAQEQADFEAGFKGERIKEDSPEEDVETAGDTVESGDGNDTAEGGEGNDTVTPEVYTKADIDRLRAEIALEAEQKHIKRIRDLSGEVGGLKEKLQKLETAKAAATDSNNQGPTSKEISDAAKGGKALDKLRQDYGDDLADALMEYAEELKTSVKAPEPKAPEPQAASPEVDETAQRVHVMEEQLKIVEAHPDWKRVVQSQECQQWYRTLKPELQASFNRTFFEDADAETAIQLINMFKLDMAASQQSAADKDRRNQRQANAVTPTQGGQPPPARRTTEHEDFLSGYKSVRGG